MDIPPSTSPARDQEIPVPRPPCATLFLSAFNALEELTPASTLEEVEEVSEQALQDVIGGINYGRRLATAEDHANCIGGRGVACWALGEAFEELPYIIMRLPQSLTPVSIRVLAKTLKTGSGSGPNPMYSAAKKELQEQGLPQGLPKNSDEETAPVTEDIKEVPDPRMPSRIMEEKIIKEPEQRPPCAQSLNRFYEARTEAIRQYYERRRRAKNPDRVKMDHRIDEEFYDETIVNIRTSEPSDTDCAACVINCPPKNGVPPKAAYDAMHRTVNMDGGHTMVPSEVGQLILRGLPRSELIGPPDPEESLREISLIQTRLAQKYGEKYSIPNGDEEL